MKKYLLIASVAMFPFLAMAQELNQQPGMEKNKVSQEEVQAAKAKLGGPATRSTQTIYVDYPVSDEIEQGAGDPVNFLWPMNTNYTSADTGITPMNFMGVKLSELVGYSDPLSAPIESYVGPFPYTNDLQVTVDSIYILLAHENNSGENNRLFIDLRRLSVGGNFADAQPILWSDSVVTNESLSPSGNWLGTNALYSLSIPCGYTTSVGDKIGIGLRYIAPKSDTLGVLASYIPNPNSPAPPNDFALKSLFPYSVTRWQGFSSGNYINTTNIFYTVQEGQEDTSWFRAQNWQIWALMTFEDVTGVKHTVKAPFGMEQNQPNPFSQSTKIEYAVNTPQELQLNVFNLNGQMVRTENLGFRTQGTYSTQIDANTLAAGTYYYKISGSKSHSEMRKMVVTH
ncbi:MAG: T9SS type A sorting domain-containing protein [Bacteroidia bacterium]